MKKAIAIKLKKVYGEHDVAASKFYGSPVVPKEWADRFTDDVIFLAQIRLADIAKYDKDNRLPHTGYLYFFLDTETYPYYPMVDYYAGEPDMVIEDFNCLDEQYAHLNTPYLMSFGLCDEAASGNKLFGVPAGQRESEGGGKLLLQFDPLDFEMGFLDNIDGYAYFFFGEYEMDFDTVEFVIDNY